MAGKTRLRVWFDPADREVQVWLNKGNPNQPSSILLPADAYTLEGNWVRVLDPERHDPDYISVRPGPSLTSPPPATAPAASFTASSTSGVAPLTVAFTDTSSGAPSSWSWSFGDGTTSTAQHPTHEYAAAGTYTVTLTASNARGSSSQATTTVTVTDAPAPAPQPNAWDHATMLGSDQLHPNDAGMTYLADAYEWALEAAGRTPAPGTLLTAYGDSWTASDSMNTPALRAIHQLRDRLGLTLTNQAMDGAMMGDIAALGIGTSRTFAAGTGGLVVISAGTNDRYKTDSTQLRVAITHYLRALVAVASAAERIEETAFAKTGTWTSPAHAVFSGGANAASQVEGSTATYTVTTPGTYYLLTYGRHDSTPGGRLTITQGSTQLAQVDLTGITADTNGRVLPNGFGPVAIRLENVQAGALTVTYSNAGRGGAQGYLDALLRMSDTPPTVLAVKAIEVPYATLNKPALLASIRDSYDTVAAEFGSHVVVCDPDPSWLP